MADSVAHFEVGAEQPVKDVIPDPISVSASKLPVNKANLIPYEALPEEKAAIGDSIALAKLYLPAWLNELGAYEIYGLGLYKAALIELVGSVGQSYFHIAIVAASQVYSYPPAAIGLVNGAVVTLYIYQFAFSSGGHFNSFITMASMTTCHIPVVRGLIYIPCQVLGWFIGAEIMRASISRDQALSIGLGACNTGDKTYGQLFAIEFMFCLLLLFPVYGTAFNLRQREVYGPIYPPILIGLTLGFLIFCGPALGAFPFTGAGMNPSLCSGLALSLGNVAGTEYAEVFRHHSVYWLAPIATSVAHAALYWFAPPHHSFLWEQKP